MAPSLAGPIVLLGWVAIVVAIFMARPTQTPGTERGPSPQAASAAELNADIMGDDPAPPKLSAEEQIKALQDQINALTMANQVPSTADPDPGSIVRPLRGPLHRDGHPIFNAGRPTGRAG